MAFPLVCLFIRSEKMLPWALLVLIVAGPINRVVFADDQPWGAYAYLSCMDGMAFGCLAALVSARVSLSERVLRVSLVAGAIIAMLVVVFCNEDDYHAGIARYGLNFTPAGDRRRLDAGATGERGRQSHHVYRHIMAASAGAMELRDLSIPHVAADWIDDLVQARANGPALSSSRRMSSCWRRASRSDSWSRATSRNLSTGD